MSKSMSMKWGVRMGRLAAQVESAVVHPGEVVLWSLAQAGICLKTSAGRIIYLDAYLSDCCERLFQFPRLVPAPITPEEVHAHLWLSTHAHEDHLDPDVLPVIARDPAVRFIGSRACAPIYAEAGINTDRYHTLAPGETWQDGELAIRAIYADHGDLAPDAIGLLLEVEGMRLYHTGDTGYRPAEILASLAVPVDLMLAPINGAFGNLTEREACELFAAVRPRLAIGCHAGMFAAQGGDPALFLEYAQTLPPEVPARVLAPGEMLRLTGAANTAN